MNAFDLAAGRAWAMTADELLSVMTIAARAGEGPEAVATRLGRPLENTREVTLHGGIAVVPLTGPIFRRANLFTEISGATSVEQFAQDVQTAHANPAVRGMVLDISSPGGEVAGINEVANLVSGLRGDKPIVAYVGDMAASGAYWIASAADQIILDATATVGSIGVVARYVKRPDQPGVRITEIVSSQSPNKRLDPETDAGRAAIQREVDAVAQVFLDAVARNRGISATDVFDRFGQGGVEVGADAVALGMADAVGSLNSVIDDLSRRTESPAANAPRRFVMSGTPAANAPITIEPLTAAQVAALYPEAAEALRAEGVTAMGRDTATAITTERERILAIQEATLPGQEVLAATAVKAGQSAAEFAMAQVRAIKAQGGAALEALRGDEAKLAAIPALQPVAQPAAAQPVDPSLPLDQRCKAEWDRSPALRGEFADNFASYLAFSQAEAQGRVRRLVAKA